jgi:glycosyltransferase involved in cell wall biosynthesis
LKIAINTRLLLKGKLDGIGWFTYHVCRLLAVQHPEVQFVFIFDRKWDPDFTNHPNVKSVHVGPPARHPLLYYAWFEYSLPRLLKKLQPDLLLNPDGFASLSTSVPQVSVMHDLNFEHFPGDLPYAYRKYYRYFFPRFANKVSRLATVSEYSKNDICTTYGIDKDRIDVVYNGVNPIYKPLAEDIKSKTRLEFSGGVPYFLFVGTLHPRKNIANMLLAFDRFLERTDTSYKLVIVGEKKWWTNDIKEAYDQLNHKDDVIFAGKVSTENLHRICASAFGMLYVSIFEGFGVPIIEAMRCGVPVITSDVTSMPEVSNGAALLTDPFSIQSIADAMGSLSGDGDLRQSLITKGMARAEEFSWERTSNLLWDCMMKSI